MSRRPPRYRARFASLERLENRNLLDAAMADLAQAWFGNGPMSVPYRENVAIVKLEESANPAVLSSFGGVVETTSARDLWQISYDSQAALQAAIAGLGQSESIVWAEPLGQVSTNLMPNDQFFYAEWGLHNTGQIYLPQLGLSGTPDADIDAPEAWDRRTSALSVVVADIDTGVLYSHPDLYKNMWINQGEIPASRKANLVDVDFDGVITFWDLNETVNIGSGKITDLNGNGYIDGGDLLQPMSGANGGWANGVSDEVGGDMFIDDIIGWDFANNDNNPIDDNGHGTHTSGTIGAMSNNGIGIAGVAWKTQIMPLKFLAANGFGSTLNGAAAVAYSALKGAKVSNNSWGGGSFLNQLYTAISDAGNAGQLFVASAGNDGQNLDNYTPQNQIAYPAAYDLPNIVSVAWTTATDGLSTSSNYGAALVDLGAPGDWIASTWSDTGYRYASGTSMAAPHVSGAAALVKAQRPSWGWSEIKAHLLSTVDLKASLTGKTVTGGRLNLQKALANVAPTNVALSNNTLAENEPANTTVGTLTSTDPDLGDTFTYSLEPGAGSEDNGSFTIAIGGVLKTTASFDFDTKSSYSIRVRTTDQGGLYFEKIFTINVTNLNEAPTDIGLSNNSVAENQLSGTTIGSLSTVDQDAGDSFTYTLENGTGGDDNASFAIDGNVLKTTASFDFETKNSYSIRVRSTDAGGLFTEEVFTIGVTDVSEGAPPVIDGISGAVTYKENAVNPLLISSAATVTDADSPDFFGGVLTVWFSENGTAEDQLSIKSTSDSAGKIGVNYTEQKVRFGGVQFATYTGGVGTTPLVFTLNNFASKAAVQALLRAITFANPSDSPSNLARTVSFTLNDGDGVTSSAATRTINVTAVNDKPVVTVSGSIVTYTESGPPVVIDTGVTVSDLDSFNFATGKGKLTVKAASGGLSSDRFGIVESGLISVNTGVSPPQVLYDGLSIGTYSGTKTLVVTFNGNATWEKVQELARHVAFSNISGALSSGSRGISFAVTDGDGGTSPAALGNTVHIDTINDAPVLTLSSTPAAKYTENAAPVLIASAATVVDVDLLPFDTGELTVALTGNGAAGDILGIKDSGTSTANKVSVSGNTISFTNSALTPYPVATFTGGDELSPLIIIFNTNALKTEVQAVLRAITFASSSDNPSTEQRTVSFTLTDGDGGTSNTVTRKVDITPKNDAPVVSIGGDLDYTITAPIATQMLVAVSANVTDVDSDDFNIGKLTIAIGAGKHANDRIEILDGSGITATAGVVSFNGNAIGTYTGTTTLVVTFNSALATPVAVQTLLRRITFKATAVGTTGTRALTATLTDGDGGTSAVVGKTITVHT